MVCGSAFWKGGRDEQIGAGAVLISVLATVVLRDPRWIGPQWGAFSCDLLLLVVITAVALRTLHYWPLAAAAFQLLCVVTHIARMMDPGVHAWAYATGQVIFTYFYLFAVAVGVWGAWRARALELWASAA
jgi:hypothetical protein